jgi:flagellar motor switch protein FliM
MENQNLEFNENISEEEITYNIDSSVSDEFKRGCKLYNFRRPDKFSKEHLKALQDIHRDFVRHLATILTGYLRMEVEIDVISVDQLTYEEYICSMPSHVQNMIFKLNPLSISLRVLVPITTDASIVLFAIINYYLSYKDS